MKRLAMFLAAATVITAVGCTQKEEPKPIPQEMPVIAPVVVDTMPKADTLKSVEETKSKTTTSTKKKTTTVIKKNEDGTATGGQVRPSR